MPRKDALKRAEGTSLDTLLTDIHEKGMGGTKSIFTVERTEYKTLILPWGGRLGVRRRSTGLEIRERILTRKDLLHREKKHL